MKTKFTFCFMIISGNMQVANTQRDITIGIVKNESYSTVYGSKTVRTQNANQPYPFNTTVYLQSVAKNDKFEVFISTANSGDVVTMQDVNIFVNAQ